MNTSFLIFTYIWLIVSLIFLITFFITIFGEELFFRGLLFKKLKSKAGLIWAVIIQTALFALPNSIIAFFMPSINSIIYIFVYAFLAVGCVGSYTAAKTDSIWASLISASVMNVILVLIYF
ncbi:MAG TPA: CPBP family intramembrane glutamic endopeptidase [Halanaerobiales bacterium]|nr:CPBP family intramembrane glutamic endopeptidase [Halanaerobiales bacterium]